ncbi:MAG: penicillin acylase family protein, partial [Promethearchaeota archaeon]
MRKKSITFLLSIMILSLIFPFIPVSAGNSEILIIRDDYGVPHIFADTKEGLAFGMGYAVGEDRLWQTDLYRRSSFGSLAEFGLASIEQDYYTRSLGYSKEELQEIFDKWEPTQPEAKLKEMSLAYVDGLNAYINEAQTRFFVHGDPSMIPIEYLANNL